MGRGLELRRGGGGARGGDRKTRLFWGVEYVRRTGLLYYQTQTLYLKGCVVFVVLNNICKYVNKVTHQLSGIIHALKRWVNAMRWRGEVRVR